MLRNLPDGAGFTKDIREVPMLILPSITPRIVNALYGEAIVLAEEVRERFDSFRQSLELQAGELQAGELQAGEFQRSLTDEAAHDEETRIAVSCEALRTANRMTHCMAWLLNHRAHFAGELSALQLRRQGRFINDFPIADHRVMKLMPPELQSTVAATHRFYARIARLDRGWREGATPATANVVERLRQRVSARLRAAS